MWSSVREAVGCLIRSRGHLPAARLHLLALAPAPRCVRLWDPKSASSRGGVPKGPPPASGEVWYPLAPPLSSREGFGCRTGTLLPFGDIHVLSGGHPRPPSPLLVFVMYMGDVQVYSFMSDAG